MSDNNAGSSCGGFNYLSSLTTNNDTINTMETLTNDETSMRNKTSIMPPPNNVCPDALFTNSMERLKAAQIELALAQKCKWNAHDKRFVPVDTSNVTVCYIYVMGKITISYHIL